MESKKGFYIGDHNSENEFKVKIGRLKDERGNGTMLVEIVAKNGSKVANLEGNIHYPLTLLEKARDICVSQGGKVYISDDKIIYALDSWYWYNEWHWYSKGKIKSDDFNPYNDLLQFLWEDYLNHNKDLEK